MLGAWELACLACLASMALENAVDVEEPSTATTTREHAIE